MPSSLYSDLERKLASAGPAAAVDQLIDHLTNKGEYAALFYALLLKARQELGVSPIPTEPATDLPAEHHAAYEGAIRRAATTVGQHYLDSGNIPAAWNYFRLINEPAPVRAALDRLVLDDDDDVAPLVDLAFHQGVNPQRGFDLVLERQGICSAITLTASFESAMTPELRAYCIERLVRALSSQLHERLRAIIADSEGDPPPADSPLDRLWNSRHWLFEGEPWHIDQSHLSAVVQLSVHLQPGADLELARALCRYGEQLPARMRGSGDPPFEDLYRDTGRYLQAVAGENAHAALEHFRNAARTTDPELSTLPAETLVNLLLRCALDDEALTAARKYLLRADDRQLRCPGPQELSRRLDRFDDFAEIARLRGDAVQFLAGLMAQRSGSPQRKQGS